MSPATLYSPDSPVPRSPPSSLDRELLKTRHDEATAPILAKSYVQTLLAFAKIPPLETTLHARQATLFQATAARLAEAFL
ncbi:hypothetical protein ACRE_091310 [Hapsidospora chrysogenum ATCC 11550]|uniref:Uncharacterized protein n=1 Tax=Hapsidospora chrysogenum (strain ATCC 11550 / CBS 779.69 / DSM 880 / IAM 14645 / JCM 23072 / IMI 49137) TaxID=857340 RepID=A0A086SSY0_HAPC1|nr:hypothetical protein ACRE_091310 [Hapsidospora chrysogenum ATCC 11550]